MSKSQKLLIGGGAFIIVAIMVIGAFSLGVYVGERGWTAGSPSVVGAGGQPPAQDRGGPGQQPAAPREPLPKGKPDLIGAVQSVAGRSVTVRTSQGPRLVLVSRETRVERHDGQEASLADLRRNVPVAVFGQFGDAGRTLMARVIVILPPKA
ncbi:MAG: hypothetical protein ACE5I2_01570 [Anaerolineae bacterium]